MAQLTQGERILLLPMQENDAEAATIGEYLEKLLLQVWWEGESFSGKRPFGNSSWEYELYRALVTAGEVKGEIDEYGDLTGFEDTDCNDLIDAAISAAFARKAVQS